MAGPRMPKRGNPAVTYTNEKPLDKCQDAEETLAPGPSHRYRYKQWSRPPHHPTGSSCHASTSIVTVWTAVKQLLHTAGISSALNSPSRPASERERSVFSIAEPRRHLAWDTNSKQLGSQSTRSTHFPAE